MARAAGASVPRSVTPDWWNGPAKKTASKTSASVDVPVPAEEAEGRVEVEAMANWGVDEPGERKPVMLSTCRRPKRADRCMRQSSIQRLEGGGKGSRKDGTDPCVKPDLGPARAQEAQEDLPVAALDGRRAGRGERDGGGQAVGLRDVLGVLAVRARRGGESVKEDEGEGNRGRKGDAR